MKIEAKVRKCLRECKDDKGVYFYKTHTGRTAIARYLFDKWGIFLTRSPEATRLVDSLMN